MAKWDWSSAIAASRPAHPDGAVRAELIVENIGVVGATLGERLMSQMAMFTEQVEELT